MGNRRGGDFVLFSKFDLVMHASLVDDNKWFAVVDLGFHF